MLHREPALVRGGWVEREQALRAQLAGACVRPVEPVCTCLSCACSADASTRCLASCIACQEARMRRNAVCVEVARRKLGRTHEEMEFLRWRAQLSFLAAATHTVGA